MKLYELTLIINPTLDDATVQAEVEKVEKQITGSGGKVEKIDRWGIRRFTYRIGGHHQGIYVHFLFSSKPGLSTEIERNLRLSESILRYLTVQSPGVAPPKPVKAFDEESVQYDEESPAQD
jgi:small subunit ribosomal protein S6